MASVNTLRRVDFPELGKPTKPTSAKTFNSIVNFFSTPLIPGWAYLGVWFVGDLKFQLPNPPLPPSTTIFLSPSLIDSYKIAYDNRDIVNESTYGLRFLSRLSYTVPLAAAMEYADQTNFNLPKSAASYHIIFSPFYSFIPRIFRSSIVNPFITNGFSFCYSIAIYINPPLLFILHFSSPY